MSNIYIPERYLPDAEKLFNYLNERLGTLGFEQSLAALVFAREAHKGQTRKSGAPYIVHPLSMAYDAIDFSSATDEIIATMLLHDVREERKDITLNDLPVGDVVRRGVDLMTIKPFFNETRSETMMRYFNALLDSREAVIGKAFDRYANLNDAEGALPKEAIIKNVRETDSPFMPILEEAEVRYSENADMIHNIRIHLQNTVKMLVWHYKIVLG